MSDHWQRRQNRLARFRLAAIILFPTAVALALVAVWTESPNWWGTAGIVALAAIVCMFAAID